MVNKNYLAGRRFEYKVKKYYENKGYTVLRTSGSHGFADLVAIKRQDHLIHILFIQCKNHNPTNKEIEKLNEFQWVKETTSDFSSIRVKILYPDKLKEWNKAAEGELEEDEN